LKQTYVFTNMSIINFIFNMHFATISRVTSGKHSPASSEGSTNTKEAAKFPHDPVPNWYQDSLYQDAQDPRDGYYYDVEDLNID
jgi:hypothetical protein